MKILSPIFKHKCERCECKFEFTLADLTYNLYYGNSLYLILIGIVASLNCPCCEKEILIGVGEVNDKYKSLNRSLNWFAHKCDQHIYQNFINYLNECYK